MPMTVADSSMQRTTLMEIQKTSQSYPVFHVLWSIAKDILKKANICKQLEYR